MNREIKFRGKSINSGKWVYAILHGFGMDWFDECVIESSIGQFTGLHDKNGKEIYEGDILRIYDGKEYFNIIVKWSKEAMAFMACYCDDNQFPLSWFSNLLSNQYEIEVIGNIYDNKELLEE